MSVRRILAAGALAALLPLSTYALSVEDIYTQTFSLFNQIIALQKQLIQSLDAAVADLKSQIAAAQRDAMAARTELATSKSVLSSVNNQLSESQKQLSLAQSELTNVKGQLAVCKNPPTPPPEKSCTFNGVTYPPGTIAPFSFLSGYSAQSASAIPASAMQMAPSSASGYLMPVAQYQYYKCVDGDWVKVSTGNPYPCPYCPAALKPVIYLYPTSTQEVTVKLKYKGQLSSTYPPYDPAIEGWKVLAQPNGTLTNLADGREYSYLFWEGKEYDLKIDETRGFVVKGSETREFLQATLAALGLTPREYNEFVVFWPPKMEHNPYNFVQFVGEEYENSAPISISPKPDSMLRVFMAFRALDSYKQVTPQKIQPFERKGFSVVEWGGTEL